MEVGEWLILKLKIVQYFTALILTTILLRIYGIYYCSIYTKIKHKN